MDGVAIAGAVLTHVADRIRCRGVFATHYHVLADEFAASERVAVKHMACDVDAAGPGGVPKVRRHAARVQACAQQRAVPVTLWRACGPRYDTRRQNLGMRQAYQAMRTSAGGL